MTGVLSVYGQAKTSKISGMPGAFSRMGFGARGAGMGNSLSAVTDGNLVSYYNPAVIPFQEGNSFQSAYRSTGPLMFLALPAVSNSGRTRTGPPDR